MKSLGDFPQLKIPGKEIGLCRRHIAVPSEGQLLLGERKSHGTFPSWTASLSSLLMLRIDSRNGNTPTFFQGFVSRAGLVGPSSWGFSVGITVSSAPNIPI